MTTKTSKPPSPPSISDLLLEHHLAYQKQQKRRVYTREFAEHIGISDKYFSLIYNKKRKASMAVVDMFAKFFNDPRFYEAVGVDPFLHLVQQKWDKVPDAVKKRIREEMAPYVDDKEDD